MNEHAAIPGLRYLGDYVTQDEAAALLAEIDRQPWLADLKRRVQHYGWRYDYTRRRTSRDLFLGPLPAWAQAVAERLHAAGHAPQIPDQVIVNEYEPGQGIASHIDCEPCFGDTIISLSLGSPCLMTWTHAADGRIIDTLLEPRSLVVMQGEARNDWKHGIPARKSDAFASQTWRCPEGAHRRVSLTFRTVVLA
ncbi:MAG TPA: alpha-ketoglutarate-dependent dioxygenase AlkB [Herpetosiphonaceae bacterium]